MYFDVHAYSLYNVVFVFMWLVSYGKFVNFYTILNKNNFDDSENIKWCNYHQAIPS